VNRVLQGDCRDVMRSLIAEGVRVQCVVTSPPYWGLRDYGVAGQLGLEATPTDFVANMVEVFGLVRELLADDGTLWLNLGDSYAGSNMTGGTGSKETGRRESRMIPGRNTGAVPEGLKPKDLCGIPWRVAFALQDAGWWLRQDIIWCLSGGAWVYARTRKGDMPVMVKDLVRLDPSTVKLWNGEKWTQVLGWGQSNDDSERLELVLRSGERIGCTGGHVWPTLRGNVPARELMVGDTIRTCRLPEPLDCQRPNYLTNEVLWLAGLYLAEGSKNGNARQLSLSADEQRWLPVIGDVARHYGGSMTWGVDGGKLSVRLYGHVLHTIIDTYIGGAVAIDKHLKVAAWRLPNEALSALVQGYLDGDGHHDEKAGRWRLGFCRNYALERDLRTLAARLGATLTLNPGVATYQCGESPMFRGEWRWERSGHWSEKDRGEIVDIRASRARQFWDIAVEDEPHLFALASGVLTHNCKPNPMPEPVRDRCTKAHEYLFLMAKAERYYYDSEAVSEASVGEPPVSRMQLHDGLKRAHVQSLAASTLGTPADVRRNRRSVWTIATQPYAEAHFATMPEALVEPCILAGSRPGDIVFDPFMGSGTVASVAQRLGRKWLGSELNPAYIELIGQRTRGTLGLELI
jgi:DNA modification methylase